LSAAKPNILDGYQKCGFSIIGEGKKINKEKEEIDFFTMQLIV